MQRQKSRIKTKPTPVVQVDDKHQTLLIIAKDAPKAGNTHF
jgi:hypothetical protein